jgi:2-oxoglutarate-Fe(II)-dependent dioxygenase family protein
MKELRRLTRAAMTLSATLAFLAPLPANSEDQKPKTETARRYLILDTVRVKTLQKELADAATAGFRVISGDAGYNILVLEKDVHLIRFTATPGRPCDTSPPGLHKDGEKYIATHLLGCCGACGGEVIITDNDKHEMDRFTMRECGECYVFDDDRIWHMLTPVAVREGNEYAYRNTLAFDMLPEGWEPVQ